MNPACSVQVVYMPLRGPQSKSGVEKRSIGSQRHSCFVVKARGKEEEFKKKMQKLLVDHKARSKVSTSNVSDD